MNEITIFPIPGGFEVSACADGRHFPKLKMYGYTKRLSLVLYRKAYGLRRRRLVLIDCTK